MPTGKGDKNLSTDSNVIIAEIKGLRDFSSIPLSLNPYTFTQLVGWGA